VLFKREFHAGLADGSITLTFRRWKRPQVRVGGRYEVGGIGLLQVDAIDPVRVESITAGQARKAGFPDRAALLAAIDRGGRSTTARATAEFYRVRFHHTGADDRPKPPTHETGLSKDELEDLARRLERMDARTREGAWTRDTLELIRRKPEVAASQLAAELGRERAPFKADVRKLKRLGLTISHETGYELSPRGRELLRRKRRNG